MNTIEKYEDIKVSMLPEKTKDTLEKIKKATKDFTIENEKATAYVNAVHSKLSKEKPEALRSMDKKPEPKKAEPKKSEPKKVEPKKPTAKKPAAKKPEPKVTPKPTPKPKASKAQIKNAKVRINALQLALQNDPLLKGLSKTDKERDAGRTALPSGRRISKNGKVYYETRENRSDRKSPEYKDGYPYLAKGGYMGNGGEVEGVDLFEDYEDQPEEVSAILSKYELEDNDYDILEQLLGELEEVGYTFEYGLDGEPYDLRKIGQKGKSEFYAKGGMMEGFTDFEDEQYEVMAKGGALKNATYVSKRNIESIKLEINKSIKDFKGTDLLDGVYVKKSAFSTKFDAYELFNEFAELNNKVWDKLKIESGSQIYNSDSLQKKLAIEYANAGIDSKFKKLTIAQRKKVAEIMTDENEHSLRNYLALRGYLGQKEYDSYERIFDPNSRYVLNPSNFKNHTSDKIKVGSVLTSNTGVKVKVVEYNPQFGVKVLRLDATAADKPSQYIKLSKFKGFEEDTKALIEPMSNDDNYVVISQKDGYSYIMSKPTTKEEATKLLKQTTIPRGEVGKVISLEEAKSLKKVIGKKYLTMAKGINEDNDTALKQLNNLKDEGKLKRYLDVRGDGKKVFETIVPNKSEKGMYKRYESYSKSSIGTLQNEYLDETDVLNWLKKTMPKRMADGGEIETSEKLPHTLNKYFIKGDKTIEVSLDKLTPIRAREKGIANAEKYMRMAYNGEMERRKPITIYSIGKGRYKVADGNSTYAVAKKNGWKTILADVVKNPSAQTQGQKSIFALAKEIRKDGEAWQAAIQRAKQMK